MKSRRTVLAAALMAGLLPLQLIPAQAQESPAAAQPAPAPDFRPVAAPLSTDLVAGYLNEFGHETSAVKDHDDMLRLVLGDYKCYLIVNKSDLQIYAWFDGPVPVETVNKFNEAYRFCNAYVDEDKDVCIESDLDFEGGSTVGAFNTFINTFLSLLKAYSSFNPDSN